MVERRGRDWQRTCMNDPWTWTTVWGLTVGVGAGLGGGGQRGKNWDNCNRITIRNFLKAVAIKIIYTLLQCIHVSHFASHFL